MIDVEVMTLVKTSAEGLVGIGSNGGTLKQTDRISDDVLLFRKFSTKLPRIIKRCKLEQWILELKKQMRPISLFGEESKKSELFLAVD
jgi:hypothetical protein